MSRNCLLVHPIELHATRLIKQFGIAVTMLLLSTRMASAADETWVGNTSNLFSIGSNWTGTNTPPTSGDNLVFGTAGTSGLTLLDDLMTPATYNIGTVTFNGPSALIINASGAGTNGFTLTGGVVNTSAAAQALSESLGLNDASSITFSNNGAGQLTIGQNATNNAGGPISGPAFGVGSTTITNNGTGTGLTRVNAPINGNVNIVQNSASSMLRLSAANSTFTGNISIQAGTMTANQGGTATGASVFGDLTGVNPARTITIGSGAILALNAGNVFGNGNNSARYAIMPTVVINGGTLGGNSYEALPAVTLNAGTLTSSYGGGMFGSFAGPNDFTGGFRGDVNVIGTARSTISQTSTTILTANGRATGLTAGWSLGADGSFTGGSGSNVPYEIHGTKFNVAATGDASGYDLVVNAGFWDQDADYSNAGMQPGVLVKTGPGRMQLNGKSIYRGTTFVNEGTIEASVADTPAQTTPAVVRQYGSLGVGGPITFGGGTLRYAGSNQSDYTNSPMMDANGAPGGVPVNRILNSAAAIRIDTNGQNVTFVNPLDATNVGGLTKVGPGTLKLSSTPNYSGDTTIGGGTLLLSAGIGSTGTVTVQNGGTLAGAGSVGGLLIVASGGAVDLRTIPATIDTLSAVGGLTLNAGSSLGFDVGAIADSIANGGAYTFSGAGTSSINLTTVAGFTVGNYNLITGASGINASQFSLGTTLPGFGLSLAVSGGNTLQLVVTSTSPTDAWWHGGRVSGSGTSWTAVNGSGQTNFDTTQSGNGPVVGAIGAPTTIHFAANGASAANMANTVLGANATINVLDVLTTNPVGISGANTLTMNGGITIHGTGDSQPNAGATTISAPVSIGLGQTWTNNSTNKLTISGAVSGGLSSALTIAGTGITKLSGNNTYAAGTTINSTGVVEVGIATSQDGGGNVTSGPFGIGAVVQNSGTIDLHGFNVTFPGGLNGTGTITNSATDPTLTIKTVATPATYAGTIQNGNSIVALVVSGTGRQTLSGANTYTGGTTIDVGATLQLGDGTTNVGSIVGNVTANGTLAFAGNGTPSPGPGDQLFAGVVSGSGGVSVNSAATVTLSGANTYTGNTTVGSGTLVAGNASAFGDANLTINPGGTIDLNSQTTMSVKALVGAPGTNTNRAIITNNDPGTGVATLNVTAGGSFAGSILDGPTAKTAIKLSSGTLIMRSVSPTTYGGTPGVSTFSGGVTVMPGATLQIGNFEGGQGQTVNPSPVLGGATGGPIDVGGGASMATLALAWQGGGAVSTYFLPNAINLKGNAAVNGNEGNSHLTGAMNISGSGNTMSITFTNKDLSLDGALSGSGSVTVKGNDLATNGFSGGGHLFIATQVPFLGPVDNSGFTGTITLDETSALPTPSANFSGIQLVIADNAGLPNATIAADDNYRAIVSINGGAPSNVGYQGSTATIAFGGGVTIPAIGALSSTTGGDLQLSTTFIEPVALTLGTNNVSSASFGGVISDGGTPGGSITKVGAGTQILTGVNTYTGTTTVNQGTLRFGAANTLGPVVLGGGTLATGGKNQTFLGPLTLAATPLPASTLEMGIGGHSVVHFNASSTTNNGIIWDGTSLTISNWTKGSDQLFIGALSADLDAGQLSKITFANINGNPALTSSAAITSLGEIRPASFATLTSYMKGDASFNGSLGAEDIPALLKALTDLNNFQNVSHSFNNDQFLSLLDVNGDGQVTNADIQAELNLVAGGGGSALSAVPEPSSVALLAFGSALFLFLRRRGR
jgi:fibronectin-binding autotransporter adhesin